MAIVDIGSCRIRHSQHDRSRLNLSPIDHIILSQRLPIHTTHHHFFLVDLSLRSPFPLSYSSLRFLLPPLAGRLLKLDFRHLRFHSRQNKRHLFTIFFFFMDGVEASCLYRLNRLERCIFDTEFFSKRISLYDSLFSLCLFLSPSVHLYVCTTRFNSFYIYPTPFARSPIFLLPLHLLVSRARSLSPAPPRYHKLIVYYAKLVENQRNTKPTTELF